MSTVTIYRKKDNKPCTCDLDQLELMTKGEKANYSVSPVEVKEPVKTTSK